MMAAQTGLELGLVELEPGVVFFLDEVFQGCEGRAGEGVDAGVGFAVVEQDGGEVGLVDGDEVLFEVVEAIDLTPDAAAEFPGEVWAGRGRAVLRGVVFEEVKDGVDGDGVWVIAIGKDAAASPAPGEAADLVLGSLEGFLEEGIPGRRGGDLDIGRRALHGGRSSIK